MCLLFRPDLKFHVESLPHNPLKLVRWVVDHVLQNGVLSKKFMIFTKSYDDCSDVWWATYQELKKAGIAYGNGKVGDVHERIVEMYHAGTGQPSQERIEKEFTKRDSKIRVLYCTTKLEMGINIPDVDVFVVVVGAPGVILYRWLVHVPERMVVAWL